MRIFIRLLFCEMSPLLYHLTSLANSVSLTNASAQGLAHCGHEVSLALAQFVSGLRAKKSVYNCQACKGEGAQSSLKCLSTLL
jgi:hypothetical protein